MEYKTYDIKLNKSNCNYEIHHTGKGSLPNVLSGLFTTPTVAKQAIDTYLSTKPEK